jgi:hypothetical protein
MGTHSPFRVLEGHGFSLGREHARMSTASRVGTAITAGYLLGRFKKLRLAIIVGSALANDDVRKAGADLLTRGPTGMVASTAGKTMASQLAHAGRSAAVGAAGSRIGGLSDRLNQRTAALRGEEPDDEEPDDEEPENEDDDEYDESEDLEDEGFEDEDEEPADDEDEEPADDEDDDEDEAFAEDSDDVPPQRSPRRQRTGTPGGRR